MNVSRPGSLLLDRAVGTVVGGAIGDALGAGYEFSAAPEPSEVTMLRGTLTREPAGHWTDDTAMAIAILEVAARMGTLTSPAAVAAVGARFLEWFDSGPRDVGNHSGNVLSRAASGGHLKEAAAREQVLNPDAAGNGSLMRTGPVALVHRGDDEQLVEAATLMSELTHPHPDAVAACVLWTIAIDRAIATGTIEGPRAGLHLIDESRRRFWSDKITEAETKDPRDFSPNGHVVVALQAAWSAIHATRRADDHFVAGLRRAVSIGDDTDTVAAIAGYLLGACYGFSAAPQDWSDGLAGWPPTYGVGELVQLVTSAVELGIEDVDE
ncbi:MAG: ADP-ribosylglycohydrolase family protein [Acidimicrobiales bacterium]